MTEEIPRIRVSRPTAPGGHHIAAPNTKDDKSNRGDPKTPRETIVEKH